MYWVCLEYGTAVSVKLPVTLLSLSVGDFIRTRSQCTGFIYDSRSNGSAGGSGGINNAGTLTVNSRTISNNSADGGTRANSSVGHGGTSAGKDGNGIRNSDTLTLRNTIVANSTAVDCDNRDKCGKQSTRFWG